MKRVLGWVLVVAAIAAGAALIVRVRGVDLGGARLSTGDRAVERAAGLLATAQPTPLLQTAAVVVRDLRGASELTPVVAALAAVAHDTSQLRGIGHIRGHETDRLQALTNELTALGSHVVQHDDGLTIHPRLLHGGEWHTYADHRMATTGALLGLAVPGVVVDDIHTTSKTLPDFPRLWESMRS